MKSLARPRFPLPFADGICARTGWVGQAQEIPLSPSKRQSEHKRHRAGIANEVSGQCEVFAKCERTIELPQNAETGAPRADANDGKGATPYYHKCYTSLTSPFGGVKRRSKPKIFFSSFCLAAGGYGGSRTKNGKKIFGFCPARACRARPRRKGHLSKSCGFCPK